MFPQDKESKEEKNKKNKEKDKKEEEKVAGPDLTAQQGVAVLGLSLISMGEDIGAEMCFRSFSHLVRAVFWWLLLSKIYILVVSEVKLAREQS